MVVAEAAIGAIVACIISLFPTLSNICFHFLPTTIQNIAVVVPCRTPDGEMFVVKDPDLFAAEIIPQYFDHNKFSSFARQLNFYGYVCAYVIC